MKRWLIIGLVLVAVSTGAVCAIRAFGDQKVIAFGTVMSFLAAAGAAMAAWGYLRETSELVRATKLATEQQNRVASIMEADLRFRVAPNLQFRQQGGSTRSRPVVIENVGRGVAVDSSGKVTYLPSGREQPLQFDSWIEPNKPFQVQIGQQVNESDFRAEMSCTDSVGLNNYRFLVDEQGHSKVEVSPRR